jgi:quinol monooxygenase YgiN
MIRVVAIIAAKPGRREELLALLLANVPTVKAEKGCIEYQPVVDAAGATSFQAKMGPDAFIVIETWESLETLSVHAVAPHMIAYGKASKDLIADRAVHVLAPV